MKLQLAVSLHLAKGTAFRFGYCNQLKERQKIQSLKKNKRFLQYIFLGEKKCNLDENLFSDMVFPISIFRLDENLKCVKNREK